MKTTRWAVEREFTGAWAEVTPFHISTEPLARKVMHEFVTDPVWVGPFRLVKVTETREVIEEVPHE